MDLIYILLRSSWQMVAIAIATGCLSGGGSAVLIAMISRSVSEGEIQNWSHLAVGFAGLSLLTLVTGIVSQLMLIRLAQDAILQLRVGLSQQILSAELAHLERLGAARLLATLTDDVQMVADAVRLIPFVCIDLATVIGCLVYIVWLSWSGFLLVCLITALALLSCRWLMRRGRQQLALARVDQDDLFKQFQAVTEGSKELKLHHGRRQAFLNLGLQARATSFRQHNVNGLSFFAITSSWGKLIFLFAIGIVLFALPNLEAMNPQILAGYVLTFTYLLLPMEGLVNRLPAFSRASVALEKIKSLKLSLRDRVESLAVPTSSRLPWHTLSLKNVTHTYQLHPQDVPFTLGPLNLMIQAGDLVFIVGGNGSGKSTLAKLIVGLYTPELGAIYLDHQMIDERNREQYRQLFAVVFADYYLFDHLFGIDPDAVETSLPDYLKQLDLGHKVTITQGQLSTTSLSQGQRKRLALLTALLDDRPIYVFDEWAADQDPAFRHWFYTELLPQLRDRGKTILVISHDDHYFHLADRLIKLNYGQIEFDSLYESSDYESSEIPKK
jgi:putative ATP-binding cassette transporter